MSKIEIVIKTINENSGVISVVIFLSSLFIAWVSGFFKFLKKKPRFRIEIIDHSSFGCIIDLKKTHNDYPVNKTAFAIYFTGY